MRYWMPQDLDGRDFGEDLRILSDPAGVTLLGCAYRSDQLTEALFPHCNTFMLIQEQFSNDSYVEGVIHELLDPFIALEGRLKLNPIPR